MIYSVAGILLLFAAVHAVEEENIYYPLIKNMFEKRCLKNANAEVANDLIEYTRLLSHCIPKEDLVPLEGESGHERLNFLCSTFRAHAVACARKLATKIKPCLQKDEGYLHDFLVATVNETFVLLCSEDSRTLREKFDTNAVRECMDTQFDIFKKCIKQSGLAEAFNDSDASVTKFNLCNIIIKITECSATNTKEKCKDKGVAEYIASRYAGLTSQCDCHEAEHQHHHH